MDLLQRLQALDDLLPALADTLDIRVVFQRVSEIAQRVIPHDMLALIMIGDGRSSAELHAVSGGTFQQPTRVPIPAAMQFWLTSPWEYRIFADLQEDPNAVHMATARAGYRSALRVAIRDTSELIAILEFSSVRPAVYDEELAITARRVADHVALALSHQRLAEQCERTAEARERAALLERRVRALTAERDADDDHRIIVGESPAWKEVLKQATKVAATDTTVLLLGESGTGKEVVARLIHRVSALNSGPFIAINCAALPEQLLESELFGHERGAFTGATTSKPGQLELAAGGVLFLDEVSEMSPVAQAKLLRVLQEREFQRLGGTRMLKSKARVIAASNRDISAAIARGAFREDLYYRLAVFEIRLPRLCDRREDILPLSERFLRQIGRAFGRPPAGISRDARQLLLNYHWPGNVRQLRNALERAAILCEGGLITGEHLSLPASSQVAPAASADIAAPRNRDEPPRPEGGLRSLERAAIEQAVREAGFNKSKAARLLGLTRTQLYVRLRKYGLDYQCHVR